MTIQNLTCACGGAFEGPVDPSPNENVTCLGCGRILTFEVAINEFAERDAAKRAADIERMFGEVGKKS